MMKTKVRKTSQIVVLSLLIILIFLLYLYFIGVPKTKARHFYNLGETYLRLNNKELARQYFEDALSYWREGYIEDALKELQTEKSEESSV